MKLYKVFNGFKGHTDVHCFVLAENEKSALEKAGKIFKKENPEYPDYYQNLTAKIIFNNCDLSQVSEISDE